MSRFVQLHVLTSYPPSNLNRDDTGRPKTALMGDALRLRISSQSQKRAWRTSDTFASFLPEGQALLGTRTKRIGLEWIYPKLLEQGISDEEAKKWSMILQRTYGEPEKEDENDEEKALLNGQLVHVSPVEQERLKALIVDLSKYLKDGASNEVAEKVVKAVAKRDKASDKKKGNATLARELAELLLVQEATAIDIALFGRMLASVPAFNFDAAIQVAHAITVHKSAVEDDYFSAVDDLNSGLTDKGAAHIGERSYGAGLFYLYICIDRALLVDNLGGDKTLADKALQAFIHAVTKVSPTGMQNSHASRAYASYVLAEKGDQQPRSLAQAFLKPVKPFEGEDMLEKAVKAIETRRTNFDKVYGTCADARYAINAETGEGSLDELIRFTQE
mgnify:CR=1 FL=1